MTFVRVGILLSDFKRSHSFERIISLRGEVWTHKSSLTPRPSQESERSSICVLRVPILPRSTILLFSVLELFRQCGIFSFSFFILYNG